MTRFRLCALTCCAAFAGCGPREIAMPSLQPIQGRAFLPRGKPAPFVKLEFYPTTANGIAAFANTDATGAFTPKSAGQDGMSSGVFKVVAKSTPKTGAKLDAQFADDVGTPLRATVTPGEQTLTVTLK